MHDESADRLTRSAISAGPRRRAIGVAVGGVLTAATTAFGRLLPATRASTRRKYSEREIIRLIHKAADRYRQPRKDMVRVARCESNLDPRARNPAGPYLGLFQFLRSTWKTTPYRDDDIFDPKANALAAAWMWKEGRRDEWTCQ